MKLKTDDQGHAILQDGMPVYIKDDGTELPFDAGKAFTKIGQLTGEAAGHRKRYEEAESRLKLFDGIDDADKAREAIKTMANLDAKKLVDAGEIEKVKAEIGSAYQKQLDEANAKMQGFEQQLYAEKVGGAFARSKFIADRLVIPADMAQAQFGKNFAIEDGRVVAKDANGNKLYSGKNPGELADFEEAIEMLIAQYPHKEHILKGSTANGMGAGGGGKPSAQKGNMGGSRSEREAAILNRFPDLKG